MNRTLLLLLICALAGTLFLPSLSDGRRGGRGEDDHESGSHHGRWAVPDSEEYRSNPVPASAASIAEGGKLYRTYCAGCHGESGRGDGPAGAGLTPRPANLAHEAGRERPGELAWKIANGRPPMPAWKNTLSETQIWHVVNYLQSIGDRRDRHR